MLAVRSLVLDSYKAVRGMDSCPQRSQSPDPYILPGLALLFQLQLIWIWSCFSFFVLYTAKSNFSAKQVIKSKNYADALRVGPSPVLLQFLIILS